jgi:GMP synthase (glutamine-hydrolysing)
MASATSTARPDRARVVAVLLQARNETDPAREHEHACFAARMGLHPDQVRCISIFDTDLSSLDLRSVDVVLVGGAGQYSVLDSMDAIRSFVDYTAWLATSPTTRELPVFASCFGFQALVLGLGGSVVQDEPAAEVGSYVLRLKSAAADDPLFSELPQNFIGQLGHKDRAESLPSALMDLAESADCPHQAVRVTGRPQVATQFHPELTAADNRSRFLRYMPEYGKLFGEAAAQERLDSHVPSVEANALLERFTEMYVMPRCHSRGA